MTGAESLTGNRFETRWVHSNTVPVEEEPHAPGRRLTNSAGPEFTDSGNDGTRLVKASTVGHRIKSPRLPSRQTLGLWDSGPGRQVRAMAT
jgi:hypothetical protein